MIKAFPSVISIHNGRQEHSGMDLRDYFSGLAMQGLLQHIDVRNQISQRFVAEISYEMADAMMKAREQHDRMEEEASVPKD